MALRSDRLDKFDTGFHQAGRSLLDAEAPELVEERELDVIPERPLRVRHAGIERHRVELLRRELRPAQDEAHLRTVAVRDHEPEVLVPEERRDVAARFGARLVLVRDALVLLVRDERVPADGDDGRPGHVSPLEELIPYPRSVMSADRPAPTAPPPDLAPQDVVLRFLESTGRPSEALHPKTLATIRKQAGLK